MLQLVTCHQQIEMSLWAQVTISWPLKTTCVLFTWQACLYRQLGESTAMALQQVLLCKSGKQQDQSCYALASATLRLDSRQKKREGRGKKRLLEQTAEMSSTVQTTEM